MCSDTQETLPPPKSYSQSQVPTTPEVQTIAVFPPLTSARSRRCSRENTAICSSSSSLYESSINYDDWGGGSTNAVYSSDDHNYSDDDETDTDIDLDVLGRTNSIRRSQELFRKDSWEKDLSSGTRSPTFNKSKVMRNDYFSSPINENTPIFKRLVSRNSLKPQLKSFKRITAELQRESIPLENEINYERLILLKLQETNQDGVSLAKEYFGKGKRSLNELQSYTSKKVDIIKKANENWNLKKNGSISEKPLHLKEGINLDKSQESSTLAEGSDKLEGSNAITITPQPLKKRAYDQEIMSPPSLGFKHNFKRRAVSTSPVSSGFFKRGNTKMVSNASEDLKKMRID